MTNALAVVEDMGEKLLQRATTPTVLAPLHLPVIEQFFYDIYDERYPLGAFSQVRWLHGKIRKRHWKALVDRTYEQMQVSILHAMVSLTSVQVGRVQREMQHAEALRFEAERLRVLNTVSLEYELTRLDHHTGLQRAQMLLQAQIDQAGEKLRHECGLELQRGTQQHELAMANQQLLTAITTRTNAVQRTTEGLAAMQQVWAEIAAINALPDEDEKHRRLSILQGALPFLLRFDG